MKKIIVIGDLESNNIGDPLLVDNFSKILERQGVEVTKWDINNFVKNEPIIVGQSHGTLQRIKKAVHSFVPKGVEEWYYYTSTNEDWESLRRYMNQNKIDRLVFAGGQMFMSYYVKQISSIVKIADDYKVPVFFNAIGVGNLKNYLIRHNLKRALNKNIVKGISIRDSSALMEKILHRKVKIHIDSVAMSNFVYTENPTKVDVGIGVIYRENQQELIKSQLIFIINTLNRQGKEWRLFSNGDVNDYKFGLAILKEMGYDSKKMTKRPLNPKELIYTVTGFKKVIAYRLHAHIISYAFNIPSYGLTWDKKVMEFFTLINHPERVTGLNDLSYLESSLKSLQEWKIDSTRKEKLISEAMDNIVELAN